MCHLTVHSEQRPFVCDRPECGKRFKCQKVLTIAFENTYNYIETFVCDYPECGYKCHTKGLLNKHKLKHSTDTPFACDWPECGKQFKSKGLLYLSYEKSYKCERICVRMARM